MSKYNFDLDMTTQNSNSLIISRIVPHSKVLEVGCAHGRMTKYLKETLNCEVDLVEIDSESLAQAEKWANKSFCQNIEEESTWERFEKENCNNYKHIIFADVLEHLINPGKVLSNCKKILQEDGTILISIPNIAHNSILIDLWNNRFDYKDVGLLDNTHLRFFTILNFYKLLTAAGFEISNRYDLVCPVGFNEIKNSYTDIPQQVAAEMKKRDLAEVYQFLLELEVAK